MKGINPIATPSYVSPEPCPPLPWIEAIPAKEAGPNAFSNNPASFAVEKKFLQNSAPDKLDQLTWTEVWAACSANKELTVADPYSSGEIMKTQAYINKGHRNIGLFSQAVACVLIAILPSVTLAADQTYHGRPDPKPSQPRKQLVSVVSPTAGELFRVNPLAFFWMFRLR